MLLFDVSSLSFAPSEPPRLYDVSAWSRYVTRLFNLQVDLDAYRAWRSAATVRCSYDSTWAPLVEDAYIVIRDDIEALTSKVINLTELEPWCRLWDALTATSRIVSAPTFAVSGVDSWSYVNSVCTLAALFFHVMDTGDTSVVSAAPRSLARIVSPLQLDVVCGRGSAWSAMALDMTRVVGAASGVDGSLMSDAMARLRVNALSQRVADALSVDVSEAAQAMGAAILDMAALFDDWQCRCHAAARTEWYDSSPELVRSLLREEVLVTYADALVERADPGICRGWCADFGVTAVGSVCALPQDLNESISDSYFRRHVAELSIAMSEAAFLS